MTGRSIHMLYPNLKDGECVLVAPSLSTVIWSATIQQGIRWLSVPACIDSDWLDSYGNSVELNGSFTELNAEGYARSMFRAPVEYGSVSKMNAYEIKQLDIEFVIINNDKVNNHSSNSGSEMKFKEDETLQDQWCLQITWNQMDKLIILNFVIVCGIWHRRPISSW